MDAGGDEADVDPAARFDSTGTIGVEEEFYIVDEAGQPVSGIDDLVYGSDPPPLLANRIDHELFQCTIETQTPLIDDVAAVPETLAAVRAALVDHAAAHGYRIAAAGLHPTADWQRLEHATKPRYRNQLDRIGYPQHRNLTSGVHVHVGVDDADAATWIANEARWYLPLLLAVSANSPYWRGYDTRLASARAKIFEALPNTGVPTGFDSFADYRDFERRMVDSGSVADRGELWFDVRPHTGLGTVEVRSPDAQRDPDTVAAFVEYVHALVRDLRERYADGDPGHDDRLELLDENKWRALRHGHDATFLERDGGTVECGEWVDRECDRLDVDGLQRVYADGSGADRMRRLWNDGGEDALLKDLILDGFDRS